MECHWIHTHMKAAGCRAQACHRCSLESDLLFVLQDFSKSDNRLNEKASHYLILGERVSTIVLELLIPETADIIKHIFKNHKTGFSLNDRCVFLVTSNSSPGN